MYIKSIQLALNTFHKNKIRGSLTVFGVMIGIAMVIIVLSAGHGVKGLILEEVSAFGDNWIDIEVKVPSAGKASMENVSGLARGISITTLVEGDMKAIQELDNIGDAYSGVTTQVITAYKEEKTRPMVFSVTPGYYRIDKSEVQAGRFFSDSENDSAAQVIVLGSEVKNNLFGENDAVGKSIKVEGKNYKVVGVMEELGATGFFNMDNIVYIPLKTTQKKIMGINHVLWIIGQTIDNTKAESTAEEIRWLMRQRHDISDESKDDFAVTTQNEAIEIINVVLNGVTWLLVALAAISLLVGGVGIMNVMYVSVAERTFEIGLRKAVGANESDILRQFLIEAVVLTGIGGVVGIIIGGLISYLIFVFANYLGFAWAFKISFISVILSTTFSVVVGLFFGLYPARKAAALDPMVAINQE